MNSDIPPLKVETKKTTEEFACHLLGAFYCVTRHSSPQRPPWGQTKVAVVEKFKQESKYGLSTGTKTGGRCSEVAVVESWPHE